MYADIIKGLKAACMGVFLGFFLAIFGLWNIGFEFFVHIIACFVCCFSCCSTRKAGGMNKYVFQNDGCV